MSGRAWRSGFDRRHLKLAVPIKGVKESSAPDTVPNDVHKGAERRPGKREHGGLVNNLAAGESPVGSRSIVPSLHGRSGAAPARASLRSPAAAGASGPTSERTAPQEGPRIRSRPSPGRGEAPAAQAWTLRFGCGVRNVQSQSVHRNGSRLPGCEQVSGLRLILEIG